MMEFESEYGRYEIRDAILYFTYKRGVRINLLLAKQMVKDRLGLIGTTKYCCIITDNGFKGLEKEARDYLSSKEALEGLISVAFIVTSEFNKMATNFFIRVNVISPKIPVKVFTKESEALDWIKKFK